MEQLRDYSPFCEIENYSYDLSSVHNYSDLDISQTELSLKADYQVDKNLSLGCGVSYLRYEDDAPYLFDGSGDAYLAQLTISYYP